MEFCLAKPTNLLEIQAMYKDLIEHLGENNLVLWDDQYPHEAFVDDITANRLYVLVHEGEIIAAAALSQDHEGDVALNWEAPEAKAVYMERFGVHPGCGRRGIGRLMVQNAMRVAKLQDAAYLRLFVVTINEPAIKFYESIGFQRVAGEFELILSEDYVIHEYGFEIAL